MHESVSQRKRREERERERDKKEEGKTLLRVPGRHSSAQHDRLLILAQIQRDILYLRRRRQIVLHAIK